MNHVVDPEELDRVTIAGGVRGLGSPIIRS